MIEFKVTPDGGGEYKVTATSRDVYVFEKTNKGKSFNRIMSDLHMSDMYRLAHLASERQQLYTGSLDEFVASVDLEPIGDADLSARLEALLDECAEADLDSVPVGDLRALLDDDGEPDPTPPEASPGA